MEELRTAASVSSRAVKAAASINSVSNSSDATSNTAAVDAIMAALSGAESDLQGSVQTALEQGSGILSLSGQLSALIPLLQGLGRQSALTGSGLQSHNEDASTAVADLEALLATKAADVSRLSEALEVQSRELEKAQSQLKDGVAEADQLRASSAAEGVALRVKIDELSSELEAQYVTARKLEAELTACRASLVESQSRVEALEEKAASQQALQAESKAAAGDEVRRDRVRLSLSGIQWLNCLSQMIDFKKLEGRCKNAMDNLI